MASDASFVQFLVDQVNGAGAITTRYMFGEFALYCNEKVVALICDNKLYVKPTAGGRAYIGTPVEAPAYTGAKPSFLIEEQLEDAKWLTELIRITEREIGAPTAKKNKEARKPKDKDAKKATPVTPKAGAKAKPKAKAKAKATPISKPKTLRKIAKKPAKPKTKARR